METVTFPKRYNEVELKSPPMSPQSAKNDQKKQLNPFTRTTLERDQDFVIEEDDCSLSQRHLSPLQQQIETYRNTQDEIKELEASIHLQLQLCQNALCSMQQSELQNSEEQNVSTVKSELQRALKSVELCLVDYCERQRSFQSTNSEYLLQCQVNKEGKSETLFYNSQLEDRIKNMRFLLNSKEDLLAYEESTLSEVLGESKKESSSSGRKIYIDYHLPRKLHLGKKFHQNQYQHLRKLHAEHAGLSRKVTLLEREVVERTKVAQDYQQMEYIQGQNLQSSARINEFQLHKSESDHYDRIKEESENSATRSGSRKGRLLTSAKQNLFTAASSLHSASSDFTEFRADAEKPKLVTHENELIFKTGKLYLREERRRLSLTARFEHLQKQQERQNRLNQELRQKYTQNTQWLQTQAGKVIQKKQQQSSEVLAKIQEQGLREDHSDDSCDSIVEVDNILGEIGVAEESN